MLRDDYLARIKSKHYSKNTFEAYWPHVEDFIRWNRLGKTWRHPKDLGTNEVTAYLTHLAVNRHVSASTQNQALSAILFLYREVLQMELTDVDAVRAKTPKHIWLSLRKPIAQLPAFSNTENRSLRHLRQTWTNFAPQIAPHNPPCHCLSTFAAFIKTSVNRCVVANIFFFISACSI